MITLKEKVELLIEQRFYIDECFVRYNSKDEDAVEEIEKFLKENGIVQFDVDNINAFDSPGYDTGVVVAAWIDVDGSLQTFNYQWELC